MASKTTTVNISGIVFNMTESSYKLFADYLASVKKHFAQHEGKDEIVADLESRMAEHFSENLSPGKQVILDADVEALIQVMGRVEDFEAEEDGDEQDFPKVNKRFYRDSDHRIIAGVCAGLANYFHVDVRLIRLIFFISIFFGGMGIFVYGLLWIFIPEAKTTAEKEQMSGYKFDLASIAKEVEEKVGGIQVPKDIPQKTGRFFRFLGQVVSGFVKVVLQVILIWLKIISIFVTPALILATVAFSLAILSLVFHLYPYFIQLPLDSLTSRVSFYLFLTGVYMAGLVVFIALISVFMSPLKKRWLFTAGKGVALMSLFLVGALLAVLGGVDLFPRAETIFKEGMSHEHLVSTTFDSLGSFDEVVVENQLNEVTIVRGEAYSVELMVGEMCQNLYEPIVLGNRLHIRKKEVLPYTPFCDAWGAKAVITMPTLSFFEARKYFEGTIRGFKLSELEISLRDGFLTLEEGSIETLFANLRGRSRLLSSDLSIQTATVQTNDYSEVEIGVVDQLMVAPFDYGVISYHGNPKLSLAEGRSGAINPWGGVISLDGHELKFNSDIEEAVFTEVVDESISDTQESSSEQEPLNEEVSTYEQAPFLEGQATETEQGSIAYENISPWETINTMALSKDCKQELQEVLEDKYGDWIFNPQNKFPLSQSDIQELPASTYCKDKLIEKLSL